MQLQDNRVGFGKVTMKNKKINAGFTLIELLVSMGIVAVLTGMAAFNFNLSRVRARDVERKNDLNQMQKALEVYKNDVGSYPGTTSTTFSEAAGALVTAGYLKKSFADPKIEDWEDYAYKFVDFKNYYLMSCLENSADTAKTADVTTCAAIGAAGCACGPSGSGVKYIVSQP